MPIKDTPFEITPQMLSDFAEIAVGSGCKVSEDGNTYTKTKKSAGGGTTVTYSAVIAAYENGKVTLSSEKAAKGKITLR